jgi:hypothetical protein
MAARCNAIAGVIIGELADIALVKAGEGTGSL